MAFGTGAGFDVHRTTDFAGGDVSVGGDVLPFKAGGTLNVGDVVVVSAAKTVNKSATVGDHVKTVGVVVGGKRTNGEIKEKAVDVGTQAAQANEEVLVLVRGIYFVVSGAAITAGDKLKPDTGTAGRAITATAALTVAAGAVAVTSTAANGAIISGDGIGKFLGQALEAAGGAGTTILAIIGPH